MNVSDAVKARHATRAFLPRPVPLETIKELIDMARWAPSGGNLQPWHVYVLGGAVLNRFVDTVQEKLKRGERETAEYAVYPPKL